MKEPRVRIIVLNYNSANCTLAVVKSILNQSYNNFEIIVVDNCSLEGDLEILSQELPVSVHLIVSDENCGYSKGNNLGMHYQSGILPDFYLILNSDLVIEDRQLLSTLVVTFSMEEFSHLMAVSPLVNTLTVRANVGYQYQVRRLLPPFHLVLLHLGYFKPFVKKLLANYMYFDKMPFSGKIMLCDSINGAAFIVPRTIMEKLGFLDSGTFLYMEELILGKQIKNIGGVCALNGNCEVKHYQGFSTGSSVEKFNSKMEHFKRKSFIYYLQKYHGINKILLIIFDIAKRFEITLKIVKNKL